MNSLSNCPNGNRYMVFFSGDKKLTYGYRYKSNDWCFYFWLNSQSPGSGLGIGVNFFSISRKNILSSGLVKVPSANLIYFYGVNIYSVVIIIRVVGFLFLKVGFFLSNSIAKILLVIILELLLVILGIPPITIRRFFLRVVVVRVVLIIWVLRVEGLSTPAKAIVKGKIRV